MRPVRGCLVGLDCAPKSPLFKRDPHKARKAHSPHSLTAIGQQETPRRLAVSKGRSPCIVLSTGVPRIEWQNGRDSKAKSKTMQSQCLRFEMTLWGPRRQRLTPRRGKGGLFSSRASFVFQRRLALLFLIEPMQAPDLSGKHFFSAFAPARVVVVPCKCEGDPERALDGGLRAANEKTSLRAVRSNGTWSLAWTAFAAAVGARAQALA